MEVIFNEIYNETYTDIKRYVIKKCGNVADVGDILQEIYIELWNVLQKKGAEYIKERQAFMYNIARRKVSKHFSVSSLFRKNNLSIDDETFTDFDEVVESFNLEDFAVNRDLLRKCGELLKKKELTTQKCMQLFYKEEMSIKEIAVLLEITESNVKNKIYRTITDLRKLLEG
jgi:RNA polymerase sigma-70 factor (ECF subfamily)